VRARGAASSGHESLSASVAQRCDAQAQSAPHLQSAPQVQLSPQLQLSPQVQLSPQLQLSPQVQLSPQLQLSPQVQVGEQVHGDSQTQFAERVAVVVTSVVEFMMSLVFGVSGE